jgi:hypothetical protein
MTNIDENAELLPSCPFCGGAALENDGNYGEKVVYCGGDASCPISGYAFDYGAWQARATLPTAEVSEDEVVRIMAEGMEPTYSDTYSSRELIEKALRALSGNGYKVVRK